MCLVGVCIAATALQEPEHVLEVTMFREPTWADDHDRIIGAKYMKDFDCHDTVEHYMRSTKELIQHARTQGLDARRWTRAFLF